MRVTIIKEGISCQIECKIVFVMNHDKNAGMHLKMKIKATPITFYENYHLCKISPQ